MGLFERYLTVWVGLCIVAGVILAQMTRRPMHAQEITGESATT